MRPVTGLTLLLAALLLQGTAADSKCDPSSTNCQGPQRSLKESGSRPGSRGVQTQQYEDGYDAGYVHEYDSYGAAAQQEGGLLGAKVWGELFFNTQTAVAGGANYFDEREGYVPDGYGNCHPGGPWAVITDEAKAEFAYEGSSNKFTLDLDSTGMIVLTDVVHASGKNNPMVIVLKSSAFEGYEVSLVHNHFKGAAITTEISGGSLTIKVPEVVGLTDGERLVAVWKLSVCTESAAAPCCFNGQFKKEHNMCRAATGPCDRAEYCTGDMGECPIDVIERAGTVCRESQSFCDAVDECDGYSKECPDWDKEDGTPCPWAKDCDGCTMTSTLKYSRTGPNPYTKGYSGYGAVPLDTWPECVGKCSNGACNMNPIAATCCREDEEAYPLEEDEEEGDDEEGEEEEEEGDSDDDKSKTSTDGVKVSSGLVSAVKKPAKTKSRSSSHVMTRTMGGAADEGEGAKATSDSSTKQQSATSYRRRKTYKHSYKGRKGTYKAGGDSKGAEGKEDSYTDNKDKDAPSTKYGSTGSKYRKRSKGSSSKDSPSYSKDGSKKYESNYKGGGSSKDKDSYPKAEEPKKEYTKESPPSKPEYKDKAPDSPKDKADYKPEGHKDDSPPPSSKDKDYKPEDKPKADPTPEDKDKPADSKKPEYKEPTPEYKKESMPEHKHKEVDYHQHNKEQYFTGKDTEHEKKKPSEYRKYGKETPGEGDYFGGKHGPKPKDDKGPSPDYFGGKKHGRPAHPHREHKDAHEGPGAHYPRDGPGGHNRDEGPEGAYGRDGPEGYGREKEDSYQEEEEAYEEDSTDMPISCWA